MCIYAICDHCQHQIKYPTFNFCSKCGERIISSHNDTTSLNEFLNREVDEYDIASHEPLRKKGLIACYRCGTPSIYNLEDEFCYICGYSLEIEKNSMNTKAENKKEFEIDYTPIDLGRFTNSYIEDDEVCLFHQQDVAWYEYTFNYRDEMYFSTSMNVGNVQYTAFTPISDGEPDNIWNSRAAGTLYLTDRKIILYDKGFSNIWTKLSIEGDFPEQVMCFPLEEITNLTRRINMSNGMVGTQITTIYGECILAPSHRKYRGRQTPMLNEYNSLQEFCDKLEKCI
ncbi:zinc ribbon domain-containing protein [Bacillus licheniformis]|uniref:Zinc ribbon domain-containing protein n=1 Tax=Bacillus licheniformis TaxID=1402 RepID=A0AB37GF43_BACLI|nr:zinc ribbon domain-containing protein [Bacillus licheniformis]QPR71087.1 zinc ribbon domain-containing protein [Bacillus licheniformis]